MFMIRSNGYNQMVGVFTLLLVRYVREDYDNNRMAFRPRHQAVSGGLIFTNGLGLMAGRGGPVRSLNGFAGLTVPLPYIALVGGALKGWASVLKTSSIELAPTIFIGGRMAYTGQD